MGEIIPVKELYDTSVSTRPAWLARSSPRADRRDSASSAGAFEALKLRGCARIDFRMTASGKFFCFSRRTPSPG